MSYRFRTPRFDVGPGIENFPGSKLAFFDFNSSNPKTTFSDAALQNENTNPVISDSAGLFSDIFLDIRASVTLSSNADVVIWGPLAVSAPGDEVDALAASNVTVLDTAGDFVAADVEAALTELSDNFLKLSRANTISAIQTFTAALQISDQELRRPILLDYAIKHNSISSSAGILTIDLTTGNSFVTTLTENVTTVTISNPPVTGAYGQFVIKIIQDGGGGAFTVTWPASVKWPSGTAPVITVTNNAIDEITLRTIDAGNEWRGSFSQAFA